MKLYHIQGLKSNAGLMLVKYEPSGYRYKMANSILHFSKFCLTVKVVDFSGVLVVLCLYKIKLFCIFYKITLTGEFSHYSMLSCLG